MFKLFAALVAIVSPFAAVALGFSLHDSRTCDAFGSCTSSVSTGTAVGIAIGVLVGGILSAAFYGFFGYILDILLSIDTEIGTLRAKQEAAWEVLDEA